MWNRLIADPELDPLDRPRRLWQEISDPSMEPFVRLFFEIYSQGLHGRAPATSLLRDDIESWLAPSAQSLVDTGTPPDRARILARLGLAATRGLLLDLLATGDRAEVDQAFELLLTLYQRAEQAPAQAAPNI